MNMKIIDFYTRVINSLKLKVTEDGFVRMELSDGKSQPINSNGKPLVLPTKKHIDTMVDIDDDGKVVLNKTLFNPLKENVVSKTNYSLMTTKDNIEKRLSHNFASIGALLIELASDAAHQKKTPIEINKFLVSLSEITNKNPAIAKVVDTKTLDAWNKIYFNTVDPTVKHKLVKIFLKRNGTYKGDKYNCLAVCDFPVYEDLLKDDVTEVLGVNLRKKDVAVFKLIYEFVFGVFTDEKNTINYPSNDGVSPGFISLFTMYISLIDRYNRLLKPLKDIDEENFDTAYTELQVTLEELDKLSIYEKDLFIIPSQEESNRMKVSVADAPNVMANVVNNPMQQLTQNTMVSSSTQPAYQVNQDTQLDDNPMSRALRNMGGRTVVTAETLRNNFNNGMLPGGIMHNPQYAQQQAVLPTQSMIPQQQYAAPQQYATPQQQPYSQRGFVANPFLNGGATVQNTRPVPQQQYAAPQQYAMPQQQYAAPQQQYQAPNVMTMPNNTGFVNNGNVIGYDVYGNPVYR